MGQHGLLRVNGAGLRLRFEVRTVALHDPGTTAVAKLEIEEFAKTLLEFGILYGHEGLDPILEVAGHQVC